MSYTDPQYQTTQTEGKTMSNSPFDPTSIFESYRNAFAPALKAQQESVKAIERLGRYQYAVVGDYMEWSIAHANAAAAVKTPAELVTKQVELATTLGEKLRIRAQEFVTLATETQSSFTQVVKEAAAKAADMTKEATAKVVETAKKAA
jgi:phasin family protein